MREVFGPDGSYGVFVRSDTNAEDLPEFSGAGLNLTVPNAVGEKRILQAIKDVWASPFAERAYEWRAEALVSSVEVYPSVVLAKTVGTAKSGVIATANLGTLSTDEITVNVNEGVAAVVDGGVAESLLLRPDGSVRLLAQARAAYKKYALPEGGLGWKPTSGSDYVLLEDEIAEIRELVREVDARFPRVRDASGNALPWDIEFGFLDGKLHLFQIRPLVRYRQTKVLEALANFEAEAPAVRGVGLDEVLEGR
jgi:phosphoenolpyruvate synthase/pyruvate phosphate dikinase